MNTSLKEKLPQHIAIIMDGNGRWAKDRSLSRTEGHIAGVQRVEEIASYAQSLGIKVLTLYTFSTENWNRPEGEVDMLMKTITAVLYKKLQKLVNDNMRFQIIGCRQRIPKSVLEAMNYVTEETKNNTGLIVNLAFNYGSRQEIVEAVKEIAKDVKEGRLPLDEISIETISQSLYTAGLPDPDLLIRTSGELRISNFLLWQLSYSELYFTDKYWPEFSNEEFDKAIMEFQQRERRYGNVNAVAGKGQE